MAICSQLADHGCGQTVGADWNYCMQCGALLSRIEFASPDVVSPQGGAIGLELLRTGQSALSIQFEAEILDKVGGEFEISSALPIRLSQERSALVVGVSGLGQDSDASFTIRYRSTTGPREGEEIWSRNALGRWTAKTFKVSAVRKVAFEVSPKALVFWGSKNRRRIELRNSGHPLSLGQVQLPPGYRLTSENGEPSHGIGQVVAQGAPVVLFLERTNVQAGHGQVIFRDDQLIPVGTPIEVRSIPDPGVQEIPLFVFGIDFGTSNTSVIARHVPTGLVKPIEYPNEEAAKRYSDEPDLIRFPTSILIRGKDRTDLRYGYEAVTTFIPHDGDVLVTDLKSLLRQTEEPYIGIHPSLTVDYLLTWYFKKLKHDFVDAYRKSTVGNIVSSDLYVFSLPVLDYGTDRPVEYEMQRSRTLAAAKAAGFGDNVRTIHEPVSAALKMLKEINSGERSLRCQQGDRMVVFDSGGGTTDIAIFTLGFEKGKYVMEDILQIGKHRIIVNGEVQERNFGGSVVTQDLGYCVCQYYIACSNIHLIDYLNEIEGCSFKTFDDVYAFSAEGHLYQRASALDQGVDPETQIQTRSERAWYKRYASFRETVERTKLKLASGDPGPLPLEPRVNRLMQAEGLPEEDYPVVSQSDFTEVLNNHLEPLFRSFREDLRAVISHQGQVRALFVIGGNTRVRQVREGAKPCADPEVCPEINDHLRSHAVALGTVEAYEPDASVAPYYLRIVNRDRGQLIFEASPEQIQTGFTRDMVYRIPPRGRILLDVFVGVEAADLAADVICLENEGDEVKTSTYRIHFDDREIRISERELGQDDISLYRFEV